MQAQQKAGCGIVPAETLLMLGEILELARSSKDLAKITEKYTLAISKAEYAEILALLKEVPAPNKRLQVSMKAAERKFDS